MTFKQRSEMSSGCSDLDQQPQVDEACQCKGRCLRNCYCRMQKKDCDDSCMCQKSMCKNRKYSSPSLEEEPSDASVSILCIYMKTKDGEMKFARQ